MIDEIVKDGTKVATLANTITVQGTITTIISLIAIGVCIFGVWAYYKFRRDSIEEERLIRREEAKDKKELMANMHKIVEMSREVAESNRELSIANVKKDEHIQANTNEFYAVKVSHTEEIKRTNDTLNFIDKRLGKVEEKTDSIALDVKEIKIKMNSK